MYEYAVWLHESTFSSPIRIPRPHLHHRSQNHAHSGRAGEGTHLPSHAPLRPSISAPPPHGCTSAADKARRSELLRTQKSTASAYDVFLGGSCNPTTWRTDRAIPHLKVRELYRTNLSSLGRLKEANKRIHGLSLERRVTVYINA